MTNITLECLLEFCATANTLPKLPEAAYRLIQEMDSDNPRPSLIEKSILSDPGLTAKVFSSASSALYGLPSGSVRTVQRAINVLGMMNLRAIAVSAMVQATFSSPKSGSKFDPVRFAANGAFTGLFAKLLLKNAYRSLQCSRNVTLAEIFSGAVLYDLGIPVLSYVAEQLSKELEAVAERNRTTVCVEFEKMYGVPLAKLGYVAGKTWDLPEMLLYLLGGAAGECEKDPLAVACLNVAKAEAIEAGYGIHPWQVDPLDVTADKESLGIPEEIYAKAHENALLHVAEYGVRRAAAA